MYYAEQDPDYDNVWWIMDPNGDFVIRLYHKGEVDLLLLHPNR